MAPDCPECGRQLTKRGPNLLRNIRSRSVENVHDRYVCKNCQETYSEEEIPDEGRKSISMKKWLDDS